ncbi:acyl-[acyl-carrier-protein] thioesterase [Haploplasma axanthum]|uniref:Acyl-ACP thioesterase n=1 Tax=Haploplasma axanthum TaxID=29552 RepID=A0A449BEM0_HAPAX|nr:acyl-ACP thioesterase domain-containing protein [Haploplasma axanthum]VEU80878.1 Acyl-ACP thioesterase [Haploplasma axanthum]
MYNIELLISNSHVDNNGEMKETAIINALQDVEGMHILSLKEFTKYLMDNNLGVFLLYRQIDILKKPKFGEKVFVATYPYNTNILSGYRHIYLVNEKGEKIIKTNAFGAYVNLETYIPNRLPKEILKTIGDGLADETFEHLPRKIKYQTGTEKYIDQLQIKKSHIDRYHHVNNAHYITFALDSIDEDISFNRIRAEYMKSFQLGDLVKIYLIEEDGKYIFVLKNKEDENCAIVEFSTFQ